MKRITLNHFILILAFIAFLGNANAQDAFSMETTYMQDGAPKAASKEFHYSEMDGSPYFFDGWAAGEAKLSDGKTYKNLFLKYDEIQGTLMFKYAMTDSALAFAIPALAFNFTYITNNKIHNAHFLNGIDPVDGGNTNTFYQLLANGDTKLLKRTIKTIAEHVGYPATEVKRSVEERTSYYLAKGKQAVQIKNTNKAVLPALSDKADKMKQYIADNKLNVKNDEDFTKVIDYYNSK